MARKRKYELTENEVVERWAKHYPKVMTWIGKLQKRNQNAWLLWLFCKTVGKTPDELLALKDDPRSRDAERLLDEFAGRDNLEMPKSVRGTIVIAVKSFFKHNYSDLAKASGQVFFVKQKPYRKHSKDELMKIYRAAQNPRDRSLITFTWSTAIAKESLSKIQWKHLEPDWEKEEIPHIALPDIIIKGHGRGKYQGVEQHTFVTPEAKRDLADYKDYLERVKGVKITPQTNMWIQINAPFEPLGYDAFSKIAEALSQRSGVAFGWHDARRYVETALEEIKINPNWARKIRGRKVKGEEAPYSRPAIEQLRAAYKEAVPLLEFTQPTQITELQKRQEEEREIQNLINSAKLLGIPEEEIQVLLKERGKTWRKASELVVRMRAYTEKRTEANGGNSNGTFEEIHENELVGYLRTGWHVVHKLENGKVIIRRG